MTSLHVINGLSSIVNPSNVRSGIDLKALETKMISGGLLPAPADDPSEKYERELASSVQKYGIKLDIFPKAKQAGSTPPQPFPSATEFPRAAAIDDSSESDDDEPPTAPYQPPEPQHPAGPLGDHTREEVKQMHINRVMGNIRSDDFSLETERKEDLKCAMLSEIDSLIEVFENNGVDISRIPKVDESSPYATVEKVLKILRHKNDHKRYCAFASEGIMFGAYLLEAMFDGKRTFFGKYQPNLEGISTRIQSKIERMEHDMGVIVSDTLQEYNISPGTRVAMEIIPSVLIQARENESKIEGQYYNRADAARANARLAREVGGD
jgi:hypothetical protein